MLDVCSFVFPTMSEGNVWLMALAALSWGLGSALLSPCHLGILPLLGAHAAGYGPFSSQDSSQTANYGDAIRFVAGCFLTIPLYGWLIAFLGQGIELGEEIWTIPLGLMLLWFAWDMSRAHACGYVPQMLEKLRRRLGLTPHSGIFVLGIGYGLLAGGCTIGFLAPLLMVALPEGIGVCVLLSACFGAGHCLPMLVAGCSAGLARRLVKPQHYHHDAEHTHDPHVGEARFRRILGLVIGIIGLLVIIHPFLEH